jgi:serine/threonine-protein kinase
VNLGKYELQGVLGRGATGTVYAAWDPVIARRVAIKTIRLPGGEDPETQAALARFRREAQAAGRLVHANIIGVYDFGETSDVAYIVMELVDGMALREVLRRRGRLPADEALRLADQILVALEYSHAHGVVHRDIKPGNILLTADGQVKIADFGIARIEGGGHTQTGLTLGTPAYMAPEQWRNAPVDARADVFAVGALLYHLLTGVRPFEADSPAAIMHQALAVDPPPAASLAAGIPPALDAVLACAMAKAPGARYASAETFRLALQQANAAAADDTMVLRAPPPPRRRRWRLASVLLALAVGGLGLVLVRPHPPPPAPVALSPQARFADLIARTPCVLLAGQADAAHASVTGLGSAAGLATIHAAFDRIAGPGGTWSARAIPAAAAYCQALDILRETTPPFDSAQPVLGLRVPSDHADGVLRDGEPVTLTITMADFAGWMQVDYLTSDGMVFHMLPRRAGDQAMPAHRYQPGRPFTLFEPEGAFRGWVVGEPYGTDLILVTVSDRPLFDTPRPDDEHAEDYLPALRAALAANARRSAWAVAVDTAGK